MRNPYRRMADLAVPLALAVGLAACELGDAAVEVTGDHPILNFETALGDPAVLPSGNVDIDIGIGGFDLSVPDGFARATGEFPFFSGTRYLLDPAARNVTNDSRLPALGGLGTEAVAAGACRFGDGAFWAGTDGWDFYCFLEGLEPSTDYTVMLARYSLTVNGELDTNEMLLTGAVSQPDELTVLGGTPGGYPEELCDFAMSRPTYTVGVTGDQNPLVMGYVTTTGGGSLTFDCLIGSGGFWQAGQQDLTVPDSAPFAPNALSSFSLPRYNYVVIVEGTGTVADPVPTGDHVMRFQVGVDLDAAGNPINNGLAPLPTGVTDPNTVTTLPGGANAFATPVGVDLAFGELPTLASGAYKAFLVKRADGSAEAAVGVHTVDGSTATEAAFNSPSYEATHTLAVDAITAGVAPGDFDRVVISVESDAGASSPSNPFLIFDYLDDKGTADPQDDVISMGELLFGSPGTGELVQQTGIAGTGLGQIFRDSLIMSLRRLGPVAAGWSYHGYLVDETGEGLQRELALGVIEPDEFGDIDVRVAVDAAGNLVVDGSGTPDVMGLANYNLFILNMEPMSMGGAEKSTLLRFHISDDYRNKYADFFSPPEP